MQPRGVSPKKDVRTLRGEHLNKDLPKSGGFFPQRMFRKRSQNPAKEEKSSRGEPGRVERRDRQKGCSDEMKARGLQGPSEYETTRTCKQPSGGEGSGKQRKAL